MTTDDTENGWDSLAEDLGLETPPPAHKAEKPAEPPRGTRGPAAGHRDPRPEVESEADDFGAGVTAEPQSRAALYDPGPETVAEDAEEMDEAVEAMEDAVEGDEPHPRDEGGADEGGKRRRRRRRRRKKGAASDGGAEGEPTEADQGADDEAGTVEEGEAPAELDGNEDEEAPLSAVDEELEAEAAGPRPEWHVMTWAELVSKLYRPG